MINIVLLKILKEFAIKFKPKTGMLDMDIGPDIPDLVLYIPKLAFDIIYVFLSKYEVSLSFLLFALISLIWSSA